MATATNAHLPVILVRGFGGLDVSEERRIAYQGFNDGTVYPGKRGDNYIYEGMVLKFLKSQYTYYGATNVVGYYSEDVTDRREVPAELLKRGLSEGFFTGNLVIDPAMALALVRQLDGNVRRTLWVFRYYDLQRNFGVYARALVRLIDFIRALARIEGEPVLMVDVIAHSMGGLIVREALQVTYFGDGRDPEEYVNKVVTLGTPLTKASPSSCCPAGLVWRPTASWSGSTRTIRRTRTVPSRTRTWPGTSTQGGS